MKNEGCRATRPTTQLDRLKGIAAQPSAPLPRAPELMRPMQPPMMVRVQIETPPPPEPSLVARLVTMLVCGMVAYLFASALLT